MECEVPAFCQAPVKLEGKYYYQYMSAKGIRLKTVANSR